jgi:radical SAM protein with 4Fe4S-binding SPASM domain
MRTIAGPQQFIAALWDAPKIYDGIAFRLMRYVLRFECEGKKLLHNVVTGQLVVLEQNEADLVGELPRQYCPAMEPLVKAHYLVADEFDEHYQVVQMRKVLRKLDDVHREPGIIHYTILPSTACNARCYYCYQHDVKPVSMSDETAQKVVDFIKQSCNGRKVWIRWFGGEPTLATRQIDQICEGLRKGSVVFSSRMTTNGYLLDEKQIERMKAGWNLEQVMISMDGSEENYNRIKAFAGVQDNPYQRVLRNVGLLLDQGISVNIRMNFDKDNYTDFSNLLKDFGRFKSYGPLLEIRPHQINPHYPDADSRSSQQCEEWYCETIPELNRLSREMGFFHKAYSLPCLEYRLCEAAREDAVVIRPDGSLVSCPDHLGDDQIKGNVVQGIIDTEKAISWKQLSDFERCRNCPLFPECISFTNCKGAGGCTLKKEKVLQYKTIAVNLLGKHSKQTY